MRWHSVWRNFPESLILLVVASCWVLLPVDWGGVLQFSVDGRSSAMVKTRSSARVGSTVQNAPAENGTSSELRSRLRPYENGDVRQAKSQKSTSQRQVSPFEAWMRSYFELHFTSLRSRAFAIRGIARSTSWPGANDCVMAHGCLRKLGYDPISECATVRTLKGTIHDSIQF